MTPFAIQMNEPEDGVAPTDTRNRLDIRHLENADHKNAELCKIAYEEKQRERRKQGHPQGKEKTASSDDLSSRSPPNYYFEHGEHKPTGIKIHLSKNNYWHSKLTKDWKCPIDLYKAGNLPPCAEIDFEIE